MHRMRLVMVMVVLVAGRDAPPTGRDAPPTALLVSTAALTLR